MRKLFSILLLAASLFPLIVSASDTPLRDRQWYAGASGGSPTGPSADGFALSLISATGTARLSEPIWVIVEVRNTSGTTQGAWFASRHTSYDFKIVNVTTGLLAREAPNSFGLETFSGMLSGHLVPPHTSLYGQFRLDLMYHILNSGTYSIKVIDGVPIVNGKPVHLKSNTITITVSR